MSVLAAAAISLWLGPLRSLHVSNTSPNLPWWVLAPIFFASIRSGMRLYMKQTSFNTGIAEVPLVLALYFSTPADLVIGLTVGLAAVEVTRSVHVPWRIGFAFAVHFFVVSAGVLLFRSVLPHPSADAPLSWLLVLAAWSILNLRLAFAIAAMRICGAKAPSFSDVRQVLAYSFGAASVGMLDGAAPVYNWRLVMIVPGIETVRLCPPAPVVPEH